MPARLIATAASPAALKACSSISRDEPAVAGALGVRGAAGLPEDVRGPARRSRCPRRRTAGPAARGAAPAAPRPGSDRRPGPRCPVGSPWRPSCPARRRSARRTRRPSMRHGWIVWDDRAGDPSHEDPQARLGRRRGGRRRPRGARSSWCPPATSASTSAPRPRPARSSPTLRVHPARLPRLALVGHRRPGARGRRRHRRRGRAAARRRRRAGPRVGALARADPPRRPRPRRPAADRGGRPAAGRRPSPAADEIARPRTPSSEVADGARPRPGRGCCRSRDASSPPSAGTTAATARTPPIAQSAPARARAAASWSSCPARWAGCSGSARTPSPTTRARWFEIVASHDRDFVDVVDRLRALGR